MRGNTLQLRSIVASGESMFDGFEVRSLSISSKYIHRQAFLDFALFHLHVQ